MTGFLHLRTPALTVAQHLALDRELLRAVNDGAHPPLLRLWDCTDEAVVLGIAQRAEDCVFCAACAADGVPVLQRFSGGGAVWIGRGCLVYSVILTFGGALKRYDVAGAYQHILSFAITAFCRLNLAVEFCPPCDLALRGRKIAGNAQAQRRNAVLVHGSFLVNEDLSRMARYLRLPARAPAYRRERAHQDFVMNLAEAGLDRQALAELLRRAWPASDADGQEQRISNIEH